MKTHREKDDMKFYFHSITETLTISYNFMFMTSLSYKISLNSDYEEVFGDPPTEWWLLHWLNRILKQVQNFIERVIDWCRENKEIAMGRFLRNLSNIAK